MPAAEFKILCIDDDRDLLETLAEYLSFELPAVVQTANSVPSAIDMIEQHGPFDLLISDYELHPYTALDLVHHLRMTLNPIKFILYSGYLHINEAFSGLTPIWA